MVNEFFYAVEDPAGIALFRIVFGMLLIVDAALHMKTASYFLYPDSLYPGELFREKAISKRFSLLRLLPNTRAAVHFVLALYLISAVGVTVGLATRVCAAGCVISLISIQNRNRWILHSGDTVLVLLSFLLIFSNAGKAYSIDNLLFERDAVGQPWAHRLMQLQVSIIYVQAVLWKLQGKTWRKGEAVYYTMNLLTHRRRRLPELFYNRTFFQFATYSTIAVETALGTLVWIPALTYWVLGAGVILHGSIAYFMRMHLFQLIMIVSFLVFIDPADARAVLDFFAASVAQ